MLILYTLMIEAIRSSETSVLTRATLHQIPEGGILHTRNKKVKLSMLQALGVY
jgi:hypothetical protein